MVSRNQMLKINIILGTVVNLVSYTVSRHSLSKFRPLVFFQKLCCNTVLAIKISQLRNCVIPTGNDSLRKHDVCISEDAGVWVVF